jgi:hypothetical protein
MFPLLRMMNRRALVVRLLPAVAAATVLSATAVNAAQRMRWDLISVDFSTSPVTVSAGGTDWAFANDGSSIKLTGSGTFLSVASSARFSAIALGGGGTWQTFGPTGTPIANGTYKVLRGPASFQQAPSPVPPINDLIGNTADARSGLLVVEIRFDDSSRGVLTLSCHLPGTTPVATPDTVFEGITVTKDYVDYWNRFNPVPGIDANRTSFHVLSAH